MAREISKQATGAVGLPADFAAKLGTGIAESRATTIIGGGGKPFLRLLKSGDWVYGAENIDVEDGSTWAVNVMSLAHGYCCWVETGQGQKNELRGEIMISMTEHKPEKPAPIDGTPYNEQRSFELKCMDGEDEGTEVLYKTASIGGMRAVDDLLIAIQQQLTSDPGHPCPVLQLGSSYYDHTKYGRTYVPVFEIVGWSDMQGNIDDERPAIGQQEAPEEPEEQPEPEPTEEPKRARRAAQVNPAPIRKTPLPPKPSPVADKAPKSTQQAHATGQRRRPGR